MVRFPYLKPGDAAARVRTVAPLALVQHQGRWHLYADEPASAGTRTFLLRRIVSDVEVDRHRPSPRRRATTPRRHSPGWTRSGQPTSAPCAPGRTRMPRCGWANAAAPCAPRPDDPAAALLGHQHLRRRTGRLRPRGARRFAAGAARRGARATAPHRRRPRDGGSRPWLRRAAPSTPGTGWPSCWPSCRTSSTTNASPSPTVADHFRMPSRADPRGGAADRGLRHPGETDPVPARRPLRHRLGRLRGQRPDRPHPPGRHRRHPAVLRHARPPR